MPVDPAVAKSLFLELAAIDEPIARAERLRDRCDADQELFARVNALLVANDRAMTDEGTSSVGDPGTAAFGGEGVGTILAGKYKLVEEIGEGGMGSVYMAQQTEPVKRTVAVKVIKAGMDSKAILARFDAERQALAMMDHPNIARVLDAGATEGGRPFFVMELVKGVPITRYCDDRKLTARQRLELFVPVCNAIQHAHQKGAIHRDIKPSNVLVAMYDDRHVPKVIDFGVAKAARQALTESTLLTGFGVVVGTPEYMSPEQASLNNLDIDTRSDVYSLGVLLYELLTGTTPVDRKSLGKAAVLEVLRIVREVEVPRPSATLSTIETLPSVAANRGTEPAKLTRLMKGELDWLVLKALEKDRARRYETANGLARDIQRYLADEVVEARPPSTGYRLRKFVRRYRRTVSAAIACTVLLLAGIAGTTWQAWRATNAERTAKENERLALAQKQKAQANFRLAKDAVDKYLNAVTNNPKLNEKDFFELRKQLLETAVPFYRAFAEERSDDPDIKAAHGRAYHRLGLVRDAMGEQEAALGEYESMRSIFANLVAAYPAIPTYRSDLATSLNQRGVLLVAMARFDEAKSAFGDALTIEERLADAFPDVPEYQWQSATTHNHLGRLLYEMGRLDQAEATFRKAATIQEQMLPRFPGEPARRAQLASSRNCLGILLQARRKYAEAETTHDAARRLYGQLVAELPNVPTYRRQLAASHGNSAILRDAQGKHTEAVAAYRVAQALLEQLVNDFPNVPGYRQDLARGHINLALLLNTLGRRQEAEAAHGAGLRIQEQLVADFPGVVDYSSELGRNYTLRGVLITDRGEPQESLAWFAKAIGILDPALVREPRQSTVRQYLVGAHWSRGNALDLLQRHDAAVRDWDRAIELSQGPDKPKFEYRRQQSRILGVMRRDPLWQLLWCWPKG
jgi:serine/threonine protein kinase/tetratricopeptide (TPR) repeat protein